MTWVMGHLPCIDHRLSSIPVGQNSCRFWTAAVQTLSNQGKSDRRQGLTEVKSERRQGLTEVKSDRRQGLTEVKSDRRQGSATAFEPMN